MDIAARFAEEVSAFDHWLLSGKDQGTIAARTCLLHLLTLYRTSLELPPEAADEFEQLHETDHVDKEKWREAFKAAARLPFDHYGMIFDPLIVPPEEPCIGSLSDDLADIYRDLVSGLRAYERGDRAEAIWQWRFGLQHHWGGHATCAIRALHEWLTQDYSIAAL